jgi:hypothetical protein
VELLFADPFTQDGKGKLSGGPASPPVTLITDGATQTFTGTYTTKGSITSAKGVARLTFNVKVTGTATLSGNNKPAEPRAVRASATYTVKFDAVTDQISGRSVESAAAAGVGSISQSKSIPGSGGTSTIPDDLGDGSWTLVLTFTPAAGNSASGKLNGSATVSLATGQVYPFILTGTFTSHTGVSKLSLKGNGAGLGSSLQVTLNNDNVITGIVGKVSGQSVSYKP